MHKHGGLASCASRRTPAVPAVRAVRAVRAAVPDAIYAARVLLGEGVGVGEDEDRVDADAEDKVERNEREEGCLRLPVVGSVSIALLLTTYYLRLTTYDLRLTTY